MTKIYDNYLVVPRKLLTCLTEGKAGNSKRECQTPIPRTRYVLCSYLHYLSVLFTRAEKLLI